MSVVRKLLSSFALVTAALALGGCYDLSSPTGPHREDFARDRQATEPGAPGAADAVCETNCVAENEGASRLLEAIETTAADDDDKADPTRHKVVIPAPAAP